jgi:hypothetical protein
VYVFFSPIQRNSIEKKRRKKEEAEEEEEEGAVNYRHLIQHHKGLMHAVGSFSGIVVSISRRIILEENIPLSDVGGIHFRYPSSCSS